MRIVHVPYTFYPDPVGGTEIYVEELAQELGARGVASLIFAPGKENAHYEHRGVQVERLRVENDGLDLAQLYGEGDLDAARAFGTYLDAQKPDIVHLHAFTRVVSPRMAEQASRRRIPLVFTYHTPTVSCLRSGLMRWGSEPCDGALNADLCTRCRLHSLGLPKSIATLVARTPQSLRALANTHQGGGWTALRMRDLVAEQHDGFRALMKRTDRIVALCEWTRELLITNEVPPAKITVVPHGMNTAEHEPLTSQPIPRQSASLKLVTLGRLEPIKGIQLLVEAFATLPNLPIELDIYGITQSESMTPFERQLRADIARDPRIQMRPPVPHKQVVSLLRQYDLLAVPSQWLETGPLVILEAFAAGVPVLGSNLGGIAEKVTNGVDGILLPSLDVHAWRVALQELELDRSAVARMRANVRPPRPMSVVGAEMETVYADVMQQARGRT